MTTQVAQPIVIDLPDDADPAALRAVEFAKSIPGLEVRFAGPLTCARLVRATELKDDREVPIAVLALGPLTDVARMLNSCAASSDLIAKIVISGGALLAGNETPAAERRVHADPNAAEAVLDSGLPVYLSPLDNGKLNPGDSLAQIEGQHDLVSVLYLAKPELFDEAHVWLAVETDGEITQGMTVSNLHADAQRKPNAWIVQPKDYAEIRRRLGFFENRNDPYANATKAAGNSCGG